MKVSTQLMQVLHMNKGDGETSYARNSAVGRELKQLIYVAKAIIEEAVLEILASDVMGIAYLGCSSGPNTFILISHIMDVIHTRFTTRFNLPTPVKDLRVYLNDLFSTDFNSIFLSLPSFYNRLKQDYDNGRDPNQHAIRPLISAVPDSLNNKGKIYISKSSPQCVECILHAVPLFQKDFAAFLRSMAQEIVEGGRMMLPFLARPYSDLRSENNGIYQFELLAHVLMAMVSKGFIKEEKVDSFNLSCYVACAEELKLLVQKEGSFIMDRLEAFEDDWDAGAADLDDEFDDDHVITSSGQQVANTIRVMTESVLEPHFGRDIMDDLFQKYAEIVTKYYSNSATRPK